MLTPAEPAPVETPTEAARPAAVHAPPPNADAPAPTTAAPSVARADGGATAPAPAAPPTAPRPAASGGPADLQRQTITVVIQLQPADGNPAGRPVLVSVRAGQGAPLFAAPLRYAELGPLPGPVTALLQQLQLRSLEQRRKIPMPPSRPAASSATPAPPPAAPSVTTVPPPSAPPLPPPAAPVTAPVPPADPASTQLTMF